MVQADLVLPGFQENKILASGQKKNRQNIFLRFFRRIKRTFVHVSFERRNYKDNTLFRYILRELLLYFAVMYLFFFLIFFVNQIMLFMKQLLGKRIPFADVMRLIVYSLPFIIAQSAPFATLTGFLMCLGRMMSDNEILILRASGQSLSKIILRPVLALGIIISIFSFFVNDYLLPIGTIKTRQQLRKSISSNPAIEIERQTVKRLNNSTVIIGDVKDKEISDIVFFGQDPDGEQRIIIAGKSNVDAPKTEGVSMRFNMHDAIVSTFSKKNSKSFDVICAELMILNIFESAVFNFETSVSPQEMTSYDLGKKIKKMKVSPETNKFELNMNVLEYNKKFSLPFASFFFAFLAMPLALIFGKNNGQTIGLIVGIFISVFYWAMMMIGIQLGYRNGFNGLVLMWLPNLIVGMSSLFFYNKLRRK